MSNRNYKRKGGYKPRRRNPYRQAKTKTMVTGKPPTLLERMASGAGQVALLAKAVSPMIGAINTEHKYVDTVATMSAYDPGTSDSIQLISSISQGTDDNQRIGNSILAKDVTVKVLSAYLADDSHTATHMRFTLLVWKANANSNPPTIAKLFETPAQLHSAFNKDYTDQMVILKDKIWGENVGYEPTGVQVSSARAFKIFKKLNFHMRWLNATTGITENHLYLVARCGTPTSTNQGNFYIYSRLNFTDN